MRTKLVIGALLWLVIPQRDCRPTGAEIYNVSSEEGEWYRQHLSPELSDFLLAHIQVVPQSVVDEITESPLLKHQLERAKPVDDEPKTLMDVRFTAGIGHDHVQIIVTDQTSAKILKDIAAVVAKHSDLKTGLQEIADQVTPFTFQNVAMGEIEDKPATEAGFRTQGMVLRPLWVHRVQNSQGQCSDCLLRRLREPCRSETIL